MKYPLVAVFLTAVTLVLGGCGGSHSESRAVAPSPSPSESPGTAAPPASLLPDATASLSASPPPPATTLPAPSPVAPRVPASTSVSPPPAPTAGPNLLTVTRQDDRKTLMAAVDDRILVQ